MPVRVVFPSVAYRSSFLAMLEDFDNMSPDESTEFYAPARGDFEHYVRRLLDEELGLNLREGWVPCTHRWLVTSDNQVAGVTRLRHRIDTSFLLEDGGHIGYDVAPSHRGLGYGHVALRAALNEAAQLGIPRVLLYTSAENVPSRRVIERAGGVLEELRYSQFWNEQLCKYWISVVTHG